MLAQEAGEVTLAWPAVAGGLAAIVAVLAGVAGFLAWAYRKLTAWVKRTAATAERTERQVQTSNGKTLADYVESTDTRVQHLERIADANRARIDALDMRLDRHIMAGHRPD